MATNSLCPTCNSDLAQSGDVMMFGVTTPYGAPGDPLHDVRCDLVLECLECGSKWNIFPALSEFFSNPLPKETVPEREGR